MCTVAAAACRAIGRKVALIVNYDGFELEPAVAEAYFAASFETLAEAHHAAANAGAAAPPQASQTTT